MEMENYIMNMEIKININIDNDIECNVKNVVEDDCKMPFIQAQYCYSLCCNSISSFLDWYIVPFLDR